MPDVEDTSSDGTEERDDELNERILVEKLCRRVGVN
jgi:hypothetical protein